jgi:hypothetical protein
MVRHVFLAPLLALVLTAGAATSAQASCAAPASLPEAIQAAALVFVGTVISTSDNGRVAEVRVESIWKGRALDEYVNVHGSPVSGPFAASSVDRVYESGTRYLFVLNSDAQPLQDNSCSATQPYTGALADLAPPDRRPPVLYPTDPMPNRYAGAIVIGLAIGVPFAVGGGALITILLWRRSKRA